MHTNKKIKVPIISVAVIILLINLTMLSGCVTKKQNMEFANVQETFEEDYLLLKEVNDYMISVSEELNVHMVLIENAYDPMVVGYGYEMIIENKDIKETIQTLFKKGYMYISLYDGVVCFERWKKSFDHEYRAGFAYSPDNAGELDIEYIISQEELSVPGWYFYEEDYNEWRANN